MLISVVLPVYNECNRLAACVDRLREYLVKHFSSFEIIIAEDGSTDNSHAIARQIADKYGNVRLLHSDKRLGRGTSLTKAIKRSRGNRIIYMDVDLATDIGYTGKLIEGLESGASVVTGSRLMDGSRVKRPISRDITSRTYNLIVRLLFGSRLRDHQCGFKAFNKADIIPMIDRVRDNHWFWDTELLVMCQIAGLKITEFPVLWVHNGGDGLNASKVKVLKDSFSMGSKLIELKYRTVMHNLSTDNSESKTVIRVKH